MSRRQFGRLRRLPSGRWQARYPDGSGRDIAAPATFVTKAEASAYLARIQTEIERGEWRDPRLGKTTFRQWSTEWLASNPGKRATTLARDKVVLETHFYPALSDLPLSKITPVHAKACVDAMAARLAPATVKTNVGVFKTVLNAAVDAELIGRSPARAIKLRSGPPKERVTLTLEQLDRLASEVPPSYRALVLVAGVLGLRWSEAVGLQVGDVDFLRRTLTVRRTIAEVEGRFHVADTKSRSSRRTMSVPTFVVDELAKHLSEHRRGAGQHELVFVSARGGTLRHSFEYRLFKGAVDKAGLDSSLTFHGLRHVAATLMVEQGEHPRVIQARLGHATSRLTMELYAHVPEAADRQVASHLDRAWARTSRARSGTQRARGTRMRRSPTSRNMRSPSSETVSEVFTIGFDLRVHGLILGVVAG